MKLNIICENPDELWFGIKTVSKIFKETKIKNILLANDIINSIELEGIDKIKGIENK